jgi:hypothetical protein
MIWRPTLSGNRLLYERMGERDFQLLHRNQWAEVEVVENGQTAMKRVQLGKYWLDHAKRRTYERVVFDPTPGAVVPPGTLNLWRGFAVTPTPGRWPRLDAHLREVICGGVDSYYRYFRRSLARAVQRPDLRGEVANVLRGAKGAGKGVVGNALARAFGQHGLHISSPHHLTGHFNAHLRDCAFLFVDEGFWAGDKAGESVLKALITEPTMMIEAKYQNAVSVENRLSILMASNADWVVPATRDERRFFVLDVAETHVGDRPYFRVLHEELENGGLAAFLYDLHHDDLSGFDHRDVPSTGALEQQIVQSMDPMDEWWYERLREGRLLAMDGPPGAVSGDWDAGEVRVVKQALHDDFIRFCERHRYPTKRGHPTQVRLGIRLRQWLGGGWPRDEWTSGSRSGASYGLPSVSRCRSAFGRQHRGLFEPTDDRPDF